MVKNFLSRYFPVIVVFVLIVIAKMLVGGFVNFKIPESIFEQPFILYATLSRSRLLLAIFVLLLVACFILVKRGKNKGTRYEFVFIVACASVIVLNTVFIDYNYYYDQYYLVDRILIVIAFLLIFLRREFALVFVFFAILFIKQLQMPDIFYYTFTDKEVFYEILLFSWCFMVVGSFIQLESRYLWVGAWTLFSLWYILAGIGKLQIGWSDNIVSNLLLGAVPYGWALASSELFKSLFPWLVSYNFVFVYGTLLVEIGVLFFFVNRIGSFFILISLFILHLLIFLFSGIFFWKWMVFIVLLFFLIKFRKYPSGLFSKTTSLVYVSFCLVIILVFDLVKLSWFDSGVVNLHTFKIAYANGRERKLDSSFFAPYDVIFAQNRFYFLEDKPVIANTYGSVQDRDVYLSIRKAVAEHEVKEIVAKHGENHYSERSEEKFRHFINRFVTNKSRHQEGIDVFHSPFHIYQGEDQSYFYPEQDSFGVVITYREFWLRSFEEIDTLAVHRRIESIKLEKQPQR